MTPPEIDGLYGPDSEAWRLNREAMLLLGAGPRALLLQLAHPLVAAGVDEHSDFRADPWRRLQGTLRSYLTIVYGTTTAARAEIRRLNGLHRSIAGAGYTARDPDLCAVGPRDARRHDDGRVRRLARAAVARSAGALLRGDAADRAGVRCPGRTAAARPRRVRGLRRLDAGARRAHPRLARRPRPGPRGSSSAARAGRAGAGGGAGAALRVDALAVDRLAAGLGPRRLRLPLGAAGAGRVGLARRRLARVAAAPAESLPADAAGARRRSRRAAVARRTPPIPPGGRRRSPGGRRRSEVVRFRTSREVTCVPPQHSESGVRNRRTGSGGM